MQNILLEIQIIFLPNSIIDPSLEKLNEKLDLIEAQIYLKVIEYNIIMILNNQRKFHI